MKKIVTVGALISLLVVGHALAQEQTETAQTKPTEPAEVTKPIEPTTPTDLAEPAPQTEPAKSTEVTESAESAAPAASAEPTEQTELPDMKTALIAHFPFDDNMEPDNSTGIGTSGVFSRESSGYTDGRELGTHEPRFVEGKFGKGLLLEEAHANLFLLAQSTAEGDAGDFISLQNSALVASPDQRWQGDGALSVTTKGENDGEGFAAEVKVDQAWYDGNSVVPGFFIASLYLKGRGNINLLLRNPDTDAAGEVVYFDLTDEWKRYTCAFAFPFKTESIGGNHETDWKTLIPSDPPLECRLQLVCTTTDKEQATFYVDGLQLERRQLLYPGYGHIVSPLAWMPGGMRMDVEKFSFKTDSDFFNQWKKSGTISFWFKPSWDARDGTKEDILYVEPSLLYLGHSSARLHLSPAGVSLMPFDWGNDWHHMAITWNEEGDRILYVDGLEYPNEQGNKTPVKNAASISMGFGSGAPNGVVDELILFQATLAPEQIEKLASGKSQKP